MMIKAHNIRHAILGAIAFITIGSFGACSTDPLAPTADDITPPVANVVSAADAGQTIDGSGSAVSADLTTKERCVLIDNVWYCTGQS